MTRATLCFFLSIFWLSTISAQSFSCGTDETAPLFDSLQLSNRQNPCSEGEIKYLEIHWHFILDAYGETSSVPTGNFTEDGDGQGNPYNGYQRAEDIINDANEKLAQDIIMRRPCDVPKDLIPKDYRYVLAGVYFHVDPSQYNIAHGDIDFRYLDDNYSVNTSSAVNVFETLVTNASGKAAHIGNANKPLTCVVDSYEDYVLFPEWIASPALVEP